MKKRRTTLKLAKGYRFARSKKEREARVAVLHAGRHAYAHRRDKKSDFRRLWQIKINAAVREHGLSYSRFMGALKKHEIELDRKILATLAEHHPAIFAQVVEAAKAS